MRAGPTATAAYLNSARRATAPAAGCGRLSMSPPAARRPAAAPTGQAGTDAPKKYTPAIPGEPGRRGGMAKSYHPTISRTTRRAAALTARDSPYRRARAGTVARRASGSRCGAPRSCVDRLTELREENPEPVWALFPARTVPGPALRDPVAGSNPPTTPSTQGEPPRLSRLDAVNPKSWCESRDVLGVARDHRTTETEGAHGNMCIGDVSRIGRGQQQADPPGVGSVHGNDVHVGQPKEGRDTRLPPRIAPNLGNASCRHGQRRSCPSRVSDEDGDGAVAALERDQSAGVENRTAHAASPARRRRAAARSSSVGCPPVASKISARMASKSVSAASWPTTARST